MDKLFFIQFTTFVLIGLITFVQSEPQFERQQIQSYQQCQYDSDCKENAFCYGNDDTVRGFCKCKDGFFINRDVQNKTFYECLTAIKLGDICQRNFQCEISAGPMAICNENQICECNSTIAHNYTDGLCYKTIKLTEYCLSDPNCKLSDGKFGYCTFGHCTCGRNQKPSDDLISCLPAKELEQTCSNDKECTNENPHTVCDGVCKCNIEHVISRNESICLKAATAFGHPCEEDDQCSKFLQQSICVNGNCSCAEGFHGYSNKCLKSRRAGNSCNNDGDCVFDKRLEGNVKCVQRICNCVYGTSDNDLSCVLKVSSGNAQITTIYLFIFEAIVFLILFENR